MDHSTPQQHDPHTSEWNGTGEAVDLRPSNLPIARVQRAWERKPASPLARNRFHVGKLWKRSAAPTALASTSQATTDAPEQLRRSRLRLTAQSPMRAVKKLRVDSGYGLGAQASRWDARPTESPVRKIVTRAGAAESDNVELLELEEEDDGVVGVSDQGGGAGEVTIEILDEEGHAVEVRENVGEEVGNEEWEDEHRSGEDEEDAVEAGAEDEATQELKGAAEADDEVRDVPASIPAIAQFQENGIPDDDVVIEDDAQLQASEADGSTILIERSGPSKAEVSTQSPENVPERLAENHGRSSPKSSPQLQKLDEGVTIAQPVSSTSHPASPYADLVLTPKSIRSSPVHERASSAPPEVEPKPLSPEKFFKTRLSDDTALLQAFISRAQEDKSSRRLSVTQRESLSNRRDSDTVRQALASPFKPAESVLGDLDPNSPSPRKTAPAGVAEQADPNSLALATAPAAQDEADPIEDPEQSAESSTKTRRSARGRRRPQVLSQSVYSAPPSQRIQIRGHGANVDLKKSEAQELAMLTRTNTRKNKQGSVLPKLRLVKMPPQNESDGGNEAAEETEGSNKEGRRGVKWNEQLVSFFEPASVDTSGWSDEGPEERMPWERPALPDDSDEETEDRPRGETVKPETKKSKEVPQLESAAHTMGLTTLTPVPAAETPSKPKIRRLKKPRTASTPGKGPAPVMESDPTPAEQAASTSGEMQKPASTIPKPKRSRIATPAKGLTSASLLPADVQQPVTAERKAPPSAKKRLPSKLPAPMPVASATTANGNTTASVAGQGKENLTASTPAKRPPVGSLPQSKLFAPKLDLSSSAASKSAGLTFPNLNSQQQPPEGGDEAMAPGLSSPAKRGRGKVVFGPGEVGEGGGGSATGNEGLGLKSPAKKRTSKRLPVS
ncbi:hypothetical protein EJ03DRAFT_63715 [Teratosphaeria nubilosa]|uniref:Uncharacterized protein n=1 Tax=Teratosphaeria nubilosa TaxID=161662 RepID=A0A6G1LDI0_9PEZI|nr:hypothetical protein EJ03DRAFT_63715 [Teratosphaeria nubilosa]